MELTRPRKQLFNLRFQSHGPLESHGRAPRGRKRDIARI